jgi:hypothetical protein
MYFPHAFRKDFLPALPLTLRTSGTTADLTAGQLGFFNANTFAAQSTGSVTPFIIAQGSYFTSDKIGPVHGGYKESVKSKLINPKYISRVIKVDAKTAQNQVLKLEVCNTLCDSTYRLRIDMKGSPALRFLSHNLYRVLDAYTGCCADPSVDPVRVDPTIVAAKWAKQLVEYPLLKDFVTVQVKNTAGTVQSNLDSLTGLVTSNVSASAKAELIITVAYLETKFGNCTFTPTDFYELEPLVVYASMVEESGEPCFSNCFTVTETQAPRQASGIGETVLRQLILSGRYIQNHYPDSNRVDSLRMREIEADPALATVNRNAFYDQIMILHNVPRFNNPTSTFDNDQYLLVIHVPTGTSTTSITNFVVAAANAAQGAGTVVLENIAPVVTP